MILRRKTRAGDSTCTSAGRVTAQLLLSFLTFAPSSFVHAAGNSRSNGQAVLPILPDLFNPSPEPPPPAEHVFVRLSPLALALALALALPYQHPSLWGLITDSYCITVVTPYPPPRHTQSPNITQEERCKTYRGTGVANCRRRLLRRAITAPQGTERCHPHPATRRPTTECGRSPGGIIKRTGLCLGIISRSMDAGRYPRPQYHRSRHHR